MWEVNNFKVKMKPLSAVIHTIKLFEMGLSADDCQRVVLLAAGLVSMSGLAVVALAGLAGSSELKGLHSWSREQSRYDHPAMKTMRKANSASLDTICHLRLG